MNKSAFAAAVFFSPLFAHAEVILELDAAALPPGEIASQVGRWNANQPIRTDVINGRRAFIFEGSQLFISELLPPEKRAAFSVEAWVFNPEVERQETVVAFSGPKGGSGTEFNFSSGASAGAFRSGFKATTPYRNVPSAGAWHHIAWVFANEKLSVFVDGEIDLEKPLKVNAPTPMKVNIGASGEVDNKGPKKAFTGAISKVRIHNTPLSHDEVRSSGGFVAPYSPEPANGAVTDSLAVTFRWKAGALADKETKVFVSTDIAAVEGKSGGIVDAGKPFPLSLGATYFWRVEQGGVSSPIWFFKAENGFATTPQPRHATSNTEPSCSHLEWKPGKYSTAQRVYFGTSRTDVEQGIGNVAVLGAREGRWKIQPPLLAGTTYYWRVESENGSQPVSRGDTWSFRTQDAPVSNDVTFFVGSDTHYGRENNAAVNRRVIDAMNLLPGELMPVKLGGEPVRTPRGVLLTGDLLDEGYDKATAPANWAELTADYGLTGRDGRLCFPLYEGFGNHDGGPTRSVVRPAIKERNLRRLGVKGISSSGHHYSWDWDHVHLVQLNLFGGSGPLDVKGVNGPEHDPEGALEFLRDDLATNVGKSGRPVVIFQHFAWVGGMSDWWTLEAKERFREVIQPYRIACLINGHSHGASFGPWNEFLTIHAGSTARGEGDTGDFLVVRITENELIVAQRKLEGTWGIQQRSSLPSKP